VDSDLPLRIAFPVLVADAIDWLTEGAQGEGALATGRASRLAVPGAKSALVLERGLAPRSSQIQAGSLALPARERAGLVAIMPDVGEPRLIAVALLSSEESDPSPRGRESLAPPEEAAEAMLAAAREMPGRRPLWPWAVTLAMGMLVAEWTVHHRRRE
jgi:hypothetical protein